MTVVPNVRVLLAALVAAAGCGKSSNTSAPVPPAPLPSAAAATLPAIAGPKAESVRYARWAGHPVGTTVSVREATAAPGLATETTTEYELKTVTDDRVIVEVRSQIKAPDGPPYPPTQQEMLFPKWVPEAEAKASGRPTGTVSERKETLTVLGKEYAATCYTSKGRVEAGETVTETWIAEDFPGGVLKSVHRVPASKKSVAGDVVSVTVRK